jgi:hypothetical protein
MLDQPAIDQDPGAAHDHRHRELDDQAGERGADGAGELGHALVDLGGALGGLVRVAELLGVERLLDIGPGLLEQEAGDVEIGARRDVLEPAAADRDRNQGAGIEPHGRGVDDAVVLHRPDAGEGDVGMVH